MLLSSKVALSNQSLFVKIRQMMHKIVLENNLNIIRIFCTRGFYKIYVSAMHIVKSTWTFIFSDRKNFYAKDFVNKWLKINLYNLFWNRMNHNYFDMITSIISWNKMLNMINFLMLYPSFWGTYWSFNNVCGLKCTCCSNILKNITFYILHVSR